MNLGSRNTSGGCGCGGPAPQRPTSSCDTRKVKSVSRVGDNVIITFDDCTYVAAPFSVVDFTSLQGSVSGSAPENLTEVNAKLAELEKRIAMLETKNTTNTGFDPTELAGRVDTAEEAINKIRDGLVDIGNANDVVTHKAFNKNFSL